MVEEQVDQPAQHADPAGQHQVKSLLAETHLLPDAQRALPMAPEEPLHFSDKLRVRQERHRAMLWRIGRLTSGKKWAEEAGSPCQPAPVPSQ